jgi:peptide/nickel transport system ATP-binding protein
MKGGEIIERGPAEQIMTAPEHPYTRALVAAAPQPPVQAA